MLESCNTEASAQESISHHDTLDQNHVHGPNEWGKYHFQIFYIMCEEEKYNSDLCDFVYEVMYSLECFIMMTIHIAHKEIINRHVH